MMVEYLILIFFFIQTEVIVIHLFLMAAKFGEFEGKDIDDLDHSNKQIFSLLTISLFMSYLMLIVIGGIVGALTVMFNFITLIVFSKFIKKKNIDDVLSKS